jgi:type VI secretion system secreted protein Hcp
MAAQAIPYYHLKIAEVPGDARSSGHSGEIELASWGWGEIQSGSFGAESSSTSGGNLAMRDFAFAASTGLASANLMLYCSCGKPLKSAVLTCEVPKDGGGAHTYLTVTMTKVIISAYDVVVSPGQQHPMDAFQIKFEKIEFKYVPLKPDGTVGGTCMASWNLATNNQQ